MNKIKINLNDYSQVKKFVEICCTFPDETTLETEDKKYRVDAKSILGVFSLDLSRPVILKTDVSRTYFRDFIYNEKEND